MICSSSQEELNVERIAKPQLNRYSQYQSQASMYFSANNLMANETENRSLDYSEHSLNQEQIDQISDVTKVCTIFNNKLFISNFENKC